MSDWYASAVYRAGLDRNLSIPSERLPLTVSSLPFSAYDDCPENLYSLHLHLDGSASSYPSGIFAAPSSSSKPPPPPPLFLLPPLLTEPFRPPFAPPTPTPTPTPFFFFFVEEEEELGCFAFLFLPPPPDLLLLPPRPPPLVVVELDGFLPLPSFFATDPLFGRGAMFDDVVDSPRPSLLLLLLLFAAPLGLWRMLSRTTRDL
mmetsp:Transcript_18822/g.43601  ORF Transcript_18822/g.43601 Transcript_18822/m.43601 type:complete len:203 (+) Transcript_18822:1297-1905(+)